MLADDSHTVGTTGTSEDNSEEGVTTEDIAGYDVTAGAAPAVVEVTEPELDEGYMSDDSMPALVDV